ncbi:MAG: dTMP kinase [Chlamydiales bacterium]|jgi:dTMP kinase|nr:dTMP kinase [Chlamydiales bacterium]
MRRQGHLITFEGGEGVGKTTLIDALYQYLKNSRQDVVKTRAPGGTEIGRLIREIVLNQHQDKMSHLCELFLFLADRSQHVEELILPALQQKKIVLCDRFNDSTIAYQAIGRHQEKRQIEELCAFASLHISVHLTFYLDLDPELALKRVDRMKNRDRIEAEKIAFHRKIRKAFHALIEKDPKRFVLLDASLNPNEVFEIAKRHLDEFFQTHR